MDELVTQEEILLERDGFESRCGMKCFDYCSMTYRYYCGECGEEIIREEECDCGWTTIEFTEHGI